MKGTFFCYLYFTIAAWIMSQTNCNTKERTGHLSIGQVSRKGTVHLLQKNYIDNLQWFHVSLNWNVCRNFIKVFSLLKTDSDRVPEGFRTKEIVGCIRIVYGNKFEYLFVKVKRIKNVCCFPSTGQFFISQINVFFSILYANNIEKF